MKYKLYLVVFTLVKSNKRVWKMGLHRGFNIEDRFRRELDEGIINSKSIWWV